MNSRTKGVRGELEVAEYLRGHGYEAARGQQHAGGGDSPDVKHNIPGVHIEVKRVETRSAGTVYDWMAQAVRDAGPETIPAVFHRRNRKEWLVILRADDFMEMVR